MDKKSLSERTAGEGQNIDELWVWQPLYDNNAVRENIILFLFNLFFFLICYSFFFFAFSFVRFANSHQLNEKEKNNVNVIDLKKN